jgi:FMN reductase [NAD(P)H]
LEFDDLLRHRRMVRHYRPDPVPEESISRVLRVVHRAPARALAKGTAWSSSPIPCCAASSPTSPNPGTSSTAHQPWLSQAPVHIVLGNREASYHERYQESDKINPDGQEIP